MLQKLKTAFNHFLEKIAAENKKTFGDQKLDCCSINKEVKRNKKKE
ncbi:MAG: LDCC motif putative metal-binding protein [Fusobacterium sp. JB021]|nr:LDCC motif putative metal-binding protein [Fusobacterium sp. JB021]